MELLKDSATRLTRPKCVHCKQNVIHKPRGLCTRCYANLAIRLATPPKNPYGNRGLGLDTLGSEPTRLPEPTTAIPGTPEKIAVFRERAASGKVLFHPEDITLEKLNDRGIYCLAGWVNVIHAGEEP